MTKKTLEQKEKEYINKSGIPVKKKLHKKKVAAQTRNIAEINRAVRLLVRAKGLGITIESGNEKSGSRTLYFYRFGRQKKRNSFKEAIFTEKFKYMYYKDQKQYFLCDNSVLENKNNAIEIALNRYEAELYKLGY